MINTLSIRNLTVFDDLQISFSPRLNVIIGENGTGKSHLLKCAYGLCAGNNRYVTGTANPSRDELEQSLTTTLVRLFLPLDESIGRLRKTGADDRAVLSAVFSHDAKLKIGFNHNSQKVSIERDQEYLRYAVTPVFIPTKEVLSFMKGFTSLYERFGLSFDQTYNDIILALDLPELRPEQVQEKAKWAMDAIETLCGGKFVFYGGGKVTFKTRDAEYSANAMAEGFRKAGLLSRLLHTGAIQPGVSGPLFWDEPESNLNPKLMRLLVEILLELSRHGQQVIVATHSYVFMKWFDLLCKPEFEDHVLFHSLYRSEDGSIKVESTDDYARVQHNAVDDAYGELTNEQISQDMGGIGK